MVILMKLIEHPGRAMRTPTIQIISYQSLRFMTSRCILAQHSQRLTLFRQLCKVYIGTETVVELGFEIF
jgi:hypothetical protein